MSLSAALKAGLGARDALSESDGGWDPYPEANAKPEPALAPKQVAKAKTPAKPAKTSKGLPSLGRSEREPTLGEGLSDSLPAPKLAAPPERQPANVNDEANPARPKRKAGQAAKPAAVSPRQYVRELERYHGEQNRRQTRASVMDVESNEVERIAHLAARVRGRYIAKLLDAGSAEKGGLKEAELLELRHYRESHDELCQGLELLKTAIAEGDIVVSGMTRR